MIATYWPLWIIGSVMTLAIVAIIAVTCILSSPLNDCDDPNCDICAKENSTTWLDADY